MISVISNTFREQNEVQNIQFTFDNGHVISIGMSTTHYCSPRNQQGLNPQRETVELAVILPNGHWATKQIIKKVLGFDPYDDVAANLTADQVALIIAHVQTLQQEN